MKHVGDECTEERYLISDTENEDEEKDISKPCKTCKNYRTLLLQFIIQV